MKKNVILISILFLLVSVDASLFADEIHEAAKAGDLEVLKTLLEKNPALINGLDGDRNTPLFYAIEAGKLEVAAYLIHSGADVNAVNYNKESPLHIAARMGNDKAVKLLLENEADPNIREQRDRTPLFLAASMGRDRETVRLLIGAGST